MPHSKDPIRRVKHKRMEVGGVDVFYRDAGPVDAPVVLLPHGYPCSSYEFRNYMPALADRLRFLAPDFPRCGYSATPDGFRYDFDGYADFLEQFTQRLGVERFAIYLHDFGSQIGLRLAIKRPARVAALIISERRHLVARDASRYGGLALAKFSRTSALLIGIDRRAVASI